MSSVRIGIQPSEVELVTSDANVTFGYGYADPLRECPECDVCYRGLHPVSDCKYGTVERIMEK